MSDTHRRGLDPSHAEVDELDDLPAIAKLLKHDVLGLQIAMDDTLLVRSFEGRSKLPEYGTRQFETATDRLR